MLQMIRVLLGEKPHWTKYNDGKLHKHRFYVQALAAIYYWAFVIIASIVLLRLLISMFNQSYAAVLRKAEAQWRLTFGHSLLRMEFRLRHTMLESVLRWVMRD